MKTLLTLGALLVGLALATPAHAQLPPGPVIGNGGNIACMPPAGDDYTTTCEFEVTAPNNPNLSCVFFVNTKLITIMNALPNVDNPSGADCVLVAPGQRFKVRFARQTTEQTLAGSLFGNGHIIFVASGQLNVGLTASSGANNQGIIVDISLPRFKRLAVCPLQVLVGPIAGCPATGNDIMPGEPVP